MIQFVSRLGIRVVVVTVLLGLCKPATAQNSEEQINYRRAAEKEEARYEKNLKKERDTADIYYQHALKLAAIPSESLRASGFFQLALKYDSLKADIYLDFGRYLAEISRKYYDARDMLDRGLVLAPGNEDGIKNLASVTAIIDARREDSLLYDFGYMRVKTLNPVSNDSSVTRFDSIRKAIAVPDNVNSYFTLLPRFLAGDSTLSPAAMYLLMLGYTLQPDYNPFNYNDINEMKMIAGHDLDRAIARGRELEKTNPLNPTLNRELMYYCRKKHLDADAQIYLRRVRLFFSGMLFSGTGACERPYVSLWAKEEYNLLGYLGYKPTGNHAMGTCAGQMAELVDAVSPDTHQPGLVSFNVALIYMKSTGR